MELKFIYRNKDSFLGIDKDTLKLANEELVLYLSSFFIFLIPLLISSPQPLTGTIVNCILILGALYLKGNRPYYIVFLPGLATFANGILFGPFTPFLAFMLPFIWAGNAILVFGVRYFFLSNRSSYFPTLLISSIAKTMFLFSSASLLVYFSIVPAVFLNAMGILQLGTALAGGVLALIAVKIYGKKVSQ